jgi:hypothetical protein
MNHPGLQERTLTGWCCEVGCRARASAWREWGESGERKENQQIVVLHLVLMLVRERDGSVCTGACVHVQVLQVEWERKRSLCIILDSLERVQMLGWDGERDLQLALNRVWVRG